MEISDLKYHREKNAKGMDFIVSSMPKSPTVTALVIFKVGSRRERNSESGISHFLEHMVFKGNKNFKNPKDVAEAIESLGGSFNAFTSKEYTGFYAKVGAEFGEKALFWLGSLVSSPFIKQSDLTSERGVILEEINMYNDAPARQVGDYFEDLLLSGTTLGRSIIGTKKTLSAMNSPELKAYYEKFYHPKNAVFVLSGNLESIFKKNKIEKNFSSKLEIFFKGLPKNELKEIKEDLPKNKNGSEKAKVFFKKTDQTHLVLGVKTFSLFDKRRYPLIILNTILGGGMSSWAFSEIREKRGLAYYVKSDMHLYSDSGYLSINAGVNNGKLDLAVLEIVKLFSRMEKGLFKESEIKKAKDQIIGGMFLQRETSDDIAFLLGSEIVGRDTFTQFSKEIETIKKISKKELSLVAKEFFAKEKLHLALIGPWKKKDEEKFENMLK